MEFNRLKDGSLSPLPAKHVDTGMGFERLVRVIQGKHSNYDTDVFTGTIAKVEQIAGKKYDNSSNKEAIAFRVIADHIRAIAFTIADGQLPSNTGAGYVIRRILRRAVRYYYSYLDFKQPLLFQLIPVLAKQFENVFPELKNQEDFVSKVVREEELSFLRKIDNGFEKIDRIVNGFAFTVDRVGFFLKDNNIKYQEIAMTNFWPNIIELPDYDLSFEFYSNNEEFDKLKKRSLSEKQKSNKKYYININEINSGKIDKKYFENRIGKGLPNGNLRLLSGEEAFELFDTYGFPLDLTKLIAAENGFTVDETGFNAEMQQQKTRSRAAGVIDTEDWIVLDRHSPNEFVGYDTLEVKAKITRYRKVKAKGKEAYQLVLNVTPFYAESGGQVGDTGELIINNEELIITDTKKENNLIIHFAETLPADITGEVIAKVDLNKRQKTTVHHSATHLLHAALRNVLGTHVAQKGSLVNEEHLRFDFSHFAKVTDEEITAIEKIVNEKIRENIPVVIKELPKDEAVALGAMALFGEKYGDIVRVVIMDPKYSIELCGGTHVGATGELGFFKIKHETAVAAGVRRIEAVSGKAAEEYIYSNLELLNRMDLLLDRPKDLSQAVIRILGDNLNLKKRIEGLESKQLSALKDALLTKAEHLNGIDFIGAIIEVSNADALKKLCFDLKGSLPLTEAAKGYAVVLAANIEGKANVAVMLDETLAAKGFEAPKIIKEHIAPLIKGGGGGQKTLATAGGQDASNLDKVIEKAKGLFS